MSALQKLFEKLRQQLPEATALQLEEEYRQDVRADNRASYARTKDRYAKLKAEREQRKQHR